LEPLRILHLEDSPLDAELILAELAEAGLDCAATRVESRDAFVAALERGGFDLVLCDYWLPSFDGVEALELARRARPELPLLIVSGALGEELATEALKRGATDYVPKGNLRRLAPSVRRALREERERGERRRAERALEAHARRRTALAELGQRALAGLEPRALMEEAVARLAECLEAEFAHVLELLPDGQALRLVAGVGWCEALVGQVTVPAGTDSHAGYTLRAGRPVVVADLAAEARFRPPPLLRECGVVSGMSVVVAGRDRDRPFGVLGAHTARRRDFGEEDVQFLQAAADLIATAVQRHRAERELEAARQAAEAAREAAEAASRSKDQFLAILSHELRTPLMPILLTATALLDDPATPPDIRAALELIRQGVDLETRLIDDLLDVTRIARGLLRHNLEAVDAHAAARRALEICRTELERGRVEVATDLSAASHHVWADPARLQQVFWNLIKNAVKFSPGGGRLTIASRNAPGPDGATRLVVELADTGIGIEPAVLGRIFDLFEQGEATLSRRFGGLGLGLPIARSLVESYGGRLSAASAGPGRGSTFTIELATTAAPSGVPATSPNGAVPPADAPREGALRILLVEDDAVTAGVLSRLLGRSGFAVTTAGDLATALATASRGEFDLVVSDIGLPDGTGLDLMPRLRALRPVPGIALTGFGMEADVRKSHEAGFAAHLTKPVDYRQLEALIRRVASQGG
jgi:signal transduction histidine kinase/CheY-like chemotaxis protein